MEVQSTWASERSVHLAAPDGGALGCYHALCNTPIDGVAEVTVGACTVQVRIARQADPQVTLDRIRSHLASLDLSAIEGHGRVVEIPICTDGELAPDLPEVAEHAGLAMDAAIELHLSGVYTVRMLGFSPGFAYIDGLAEALHLPRLNTPRPRVRAGSVGIAGPRTCIYPQATPGGWRLIGATPLRLFDPAKDPPTLLSPGDRVQFRRIGRDEFAAIEGD